MSHLLWTLWVAGASSQPAAAPAHPALVRTVIQRINAAAPRIDACTARYLAEYPKADGTLVLELQVGKDGKVRAAKAQTKMEGARHLRPCIEAVGRALVLPPIEAARVLPIPIRVAAGARFRVLKPGEAPPETKGDKGAGGFVRFLGFRPGVGPRKEAE